MRELCTPTRSGGAALWCVAVRGGYDVGCLRASAWWDMWNPRHLSASRTGLSMALSRRLFHPHRARSGPRGVWGCCGIMGGRPSKESP